MEGEVALMEVVVRAEVERSGGMTIFSGGVGALGSAPGGNQRGQHVAAWLGAAAWRAGARIRQHQRGQQAALVGESIEGLDKLSVLQ